MMRKRPGETSQFRCTSQCASWGNYARKTRIHSSRHRCALFSHQNIVLEYTYVKTRVTLWTLVPFLFSSGCHQTCPFVGCKHTRRTLYSIHCWWQVLINYLSFYWIEALFTLHIMLIRSLFRAQVLRSAAIQYMIYVVYAMTFVRRACVERCAVRWFKNININNN